MAAALSFASASLAESATAAPQLASPALAVKAGRQRGLTVMEKRRQEEEEQMAAAEAAAAKRKKILKAYGCGSLPGWLLLLLPLHGHRVRLRGVFE